MKAWIAREKDEFYSTIVFAETMGKARSIAMHTDACEDVDFCKIKVRRMPQLDKYYKSGKKEMDWYDDNDRIALVKEAGFTCQDVDLDLCEYCSAKEFCDAYQDEMKELLEVEE